MWPWIVRSLSSYDVSCVSNRASMQGKPPRPHFSPKLREAACEAFFQAYLQLHGVKLDCRSLPNLKSGPAGDQAMTNAYCAFMAAHSRKGLLIGTQRPCSRKAFRELVRRHFSAWALTRACPSHSRKGAVLLTAAEARELARELATPVRKDDSYLRFQTLEEAGKARPRVKALVDKSNVSHACLHDWLLRQFHELKYQPEDRAPLLCPQTLRRRRLLSDVLGHRRPWFTRLSHRAAVDQSAVQHGAEPSHGAMSSIPDADLVDVYFETIFYSMFGFVIDAASFTDQEGEMHDHPNCYCSVDEVFPPHLVQDDKGPSQTRSIMVYCVLHKYGGLIVGPDVMLTGTRLEKSKVPKAQQLEAAGVDTW